MLPDAIIGIDPGSEKCGVAVVDVQGNCHHRAVVPTADLAQVVNRLVDDYPVRQIVIGDGTASERLIATLRDADLLRGLGEPVVIDESHSTEEARRNYLLENRRGWRRLVPIGLQSPREPVDDYVAEVLVRRYLSSGKRSGNAGR